jgi:hypothetical protein
MLQLMELFHAHDWPVTFCSPSGASEHQADLGALGVVQHVIELNAASFDGFIGALCPDIVIFDRFMMEEQFGWRVEQHCPGALRIVDTIDVHALRVARQHALRAIVASGADEAALAALLHMPRDGLFAAMAGLDVAHREIAALYRSDISLIISDFEMELLCEQFRVPPQLLHYCPFMPDTLPLSAPTFDARQHFISIGNFRHPPNWDSVLWLREQIWPLIRAQLPKAQLHVYGAYAPPKASALHDPARGFHVLGRAQDATAVMSQARVNLAPLRFGAGIKGKLSDGMRCGTPSVTTPIGAEGMSGGLPWGGFIESSASAIANAAVRLYQETALWERMQRNGYAILARVFDKATHGPRLITHLEQVCATLACHRRDNFTGAMLRHHQHKSTYYMAKWIEAKNRKRSD